MRNMDKFLFFYKRGGLLCAVLHSLNKVLRIILHIHSDQRPYMGNTFYTYFKDLPKEWYQNELQEQLHLFFPDRGRLNLSHPVTFNEKIQWLKIWDSTPIKTRLADKYAVREWVAEQIGDEYLIPLVGGPWEKGEDIDFDALPERFVLKSNHASGDIIVVKNKNQINQKKIIRAVNHWLKTMFGWEGLEAQYFHIPPRIIAEEFMEQSDGNLLDYKINCLNGEPLLIQVLGDRNLSNHTGKIAFYDTNWNLLEYNIGVYPDYDHPIDKPEKLEEMLQIARQLSKEFIYVRVDLYCVNNRVKFGEMTFTPGNGLLPWNPAEADLLMGELLKLPYER